MQTDTDTCGIVRGNPRGDQRGDRSRKNIAAAALGKCGTAGFVDGKVLDKDGVNELAKLPSKEILIGKVLGSLQSSLYSLAYVLQAVVDKENGTEENA